MEQKINIAELLKDCPKGMELYSTLYDNLVFYKINSEEENYPIVTQLPNGVQKWFTSDGRYDNNPNAKCVIFPKGKTTWEGFVPPCKFEDGDVVVDDMDSKKYSTATIKYIQENGSRDMELIVPYNQEIVNIDGRYILRNKKPTYPKTYEECCNVIGISRHDVDIDLPQPYQEKMFNLFKLRICRDAYWKIAGEQMGLDKPWEYAVSTDEFAYAIVYQYGSIEKCEVRYKNHFLVFPTKETRDAFFENFKELIEQCKKLL